MAPDNQNDSRSLASGSTSTYVPSSPGSSVFDFPVHVSTGPGRSRHVALTNNRPSKVPRSRTESVDTLRSAPATLDHWSYLVISGGTGGNAICSAFEDACYIMPVSDDGGSSSEIIRVLGGPSIGDIRSRLVRLIPVATPGSPLDSIRTLLAYRLSPDVTEKDAREKWRDIVEGKSGLWSGIPSDRKEVIRGFLVYFESEILRRAHKDFCFCNGSIGNYFLAAAQMFFRSLPSAIFLFSSITGSDANILPVLVTNHTVTIAAELENGRTLVGQCNISHPVGGSNGVQNITPQSTSSDSLGELLNPRVNLMYAKAKGKSSDEPLECRIRRIFYINAYGHEIYPSPNPDFITNLGGRDVLLYSCGSLWTSIIPCLALKGVAAAIARSCTLRAKILLLNSKNDRETEGYTAIDYVNAIVRTLNAQIAEDLPVSAYLTRLVHLRRGAVEVDTKKLLAMGIQCIEVGTYYPNDNTEVEIPMFESEDVQEALRVILLED